MGLQLSSNDQVLALAPDSSSAAAGKKLANAKHWKSLGQNSEALWGECQGSALYQVRIDLSTLTISCSCPSRKLPCKHGLGLLLLAVDAPQAVTKGEPPAWVTSWLTKRAAIGKRKETKETAKDRTIPPSAVTLKTAEKRRAQMKKGIDLLDPSVNDLIPHRLANGGVHPPAIWEQQRAADA